MHKYEAMFILKPDMNESEKSDIFDQIRAILEKSNVNINSADIWAEKRKLYFDISPKGKSLKFREGLFYLVDFDSLPAEIVKINAAFRLNENILRTMVSVKD